MMDVGRICLKIAGREAGKYCVIVNKTDENFVTVTGPRTVTGVKRRRCNIEHLEPMDNKIKISADASDEEIVQVYDKGGIYVKLKLKKPTAEDLKLEKERKAEKAERKRIQQQKAEEERKKAEELKKKEEEKKAKEKKVAEKPKQEKPEEKSAKAKKPKPDEKKESKEEGQPKPAEKPQEQKPSKDKEEPKPENK